MTADTDNESDKIPGTVFTPRQVQRLKVAVIVMGIALVGGFGMVIVGIVYQASQLGKSSEPAVSVTKAVPEAGQSAITLKPGQSISRMSLDGDRLAVHVSGAGGEEIRIIDLVSGKVIVRLPVTQE